MATAPPLPVSPPPAAVAPSAIGEWTKIIASGLIAAVLGGLFAALFTYGFTVKLNNASAVQQQYLAAVQEFTATGAKVDASITELADTVLDGEQVVEARKEARQAIAAHVAATQSLVQIIGQGNVDEYMKGLATLRLLVDKTDEKRTAFSTSRARFDLMSNRTVIVAEARRRIYGHS